MPLCDSEGLGGKFEMVRSGPVVAFGLFIVEREEILLFSDVVISFLYSIFKSI
jgi:hypothetical protein